jgi:hypothetical protein
MQRNLADLKEGKGESIAIDVCCNVEGNFLPPLCILKRSINKPECVYGILAESISIISKNKPT